MSHATRTIPLSKRKLVLALLGCMAFVALGVWLWLRRDQYSGFAYTKAVFASLSCMLFFGAGIPILAYKVFDTRPGLVLTEEGIIRLGLFNFQPVIPWKHITGTRIVQLPRGRVRILLIDTDNHEEVLQALSPLAKLVARFSLAQYGALHSVSSTNLGISIETLQALIEEGRATNTAN